MGGPCWLRKANGKRGQGPACTDNFQMRKFQYRTTAFSSVEQAFQSLKFQTGTSTASLIANLHPRLNESASAYGMRCWQEGQSRDDPLIANFEAVKVALMYVLNCAKYVSNPEMQAELTKATGELPIDGGASTWQWQRGNGLIHTLIRHKIKQGSDLQAERDRSYADPAEAARIMAEMEALQVAVSDDSDDSD
jgi:predicted NAD-dependent protein-ADP-ribosyltransferase YbiA (DUF1768 family)